MKMTQRSKILLFLGLTAFPGKQLFAQRKSDTFSLAAFKGDTAGYIEANFINRKEKYVNQPLRVLLNELGIPIKSYVYDISPLTSKTPGILLYFTDAAAYHMSRYPKKTGSMSLYITFLTEVAKDDVRKFYKQSDGAWLPGEEKFYGDQQIKDFQFIKASPVK
jgi:hypothetical protein